jgi:two-component system response regulator AtoC
VAVNCAAIPENLLESELFGYKKGAFTGAVRSSKGKILQAEGGTLFLDEIGDMSIVLQAKLLRVLQERLVTPLGSGESREINVRFIAATNQNLEEMVNRGEFREDLFYRLKVINIRVPSLRERKSDIPLLVKYFIEKFNKKFNKNIEGISDDAMALLVSREWDGNIRELENEIERALVLCNSRMLDSTNFSRFSPEKNSVSFEELPLNWLEYKEFRKKYAQVLDERYIRALLRKSDDNILRASKLGKISRTQIYRLLSGVT